MCIGYKTQIGEKDAEGKRKEHVCPGLCLRSKPSSLEEESYI